MFEVFEGVHCLSVVDNNVQNRLILDSKIRWETNDPQQDSVGDKEKKNIYEQCIPWLQQQCGITNWKVFGFWFGVRGTASGFLKSLFRSYNFATDDFGKICLSILKDSVLYIINYYLHS